uniref:EB domain-containing protein n=1 Tax=Romanomermis culicivorax TaxID=13658 RepID=A0A915K0D4_ROMCU
MVDCDEPVDDSKKHVAEVITCNMDKKSKFYGRCTCSPGYYRDKSSSATCQAKTKRHCPGSSMITPSIGKPCATYHAHKREYNTCGRNEFCFTDHKTLLENSTRQTLVKVGHCCPIPNPEDDLRLACPFNLIRSVHRCPVMRGTQLELLGTCPMGEYYCLPQKYRSDRACCVNPCNNIKAFVMRNRCLLPVQVGQSCEHSLQCPDRAICKYLASNTFRSRFLLVLNPIAFVRTIRFQQIDQPRAATSDQLMGGTADSVLFDPLATADVVTY